MGCTYSTPIMQMEDVALVLQAQPVTAFDPRVCEPEVLTLHHKTYLFKNRLDTSLLPVSTVFDADGTSIVSNRYKNKYGIADPVLPLFAGTNSTCRDGSELFQIHVNYEYETGKAIVRAEFQDISTKQHCEVGIIGAWRMHDGYFWIEKDRSRVREPVAKAYVSGIPGKRPRTYHSDVAPNMDPVLTNIICRELDMLVTTAYTTSD